MAATFGPRCDYFVAGRCDAGEIKMQSMYRATTATTRAACASMRSTGTPRRLWPPSKYEKTAIGEVVLKMDDLRKYYEVSANALFGGGDKKVVKANETLSFEAHEGETLAIVGESGCGKSTFAKVLMGLETATSGQILLHNHEIQDTPDRGALDRNRVGRADGVPEPV